MNEEALFLAALDLPDAAARKEHLDRTCGVDTPLRRRVEALLESHFKSGEFLDRPAGEQIQASAPTVTLGEGSDDGEGLPFLTPSTRPGSLGRIGQYEVLEVLGRGGFGIVLRAFDDVLQRVVAVKVMAPALAATSPARKRFIREAQSAAKVRHDNVVQIHNVVEQPLPFLVMEYIPGETLQQRLDRVGPLDLHETLRIGRQIAEGLAAAHATDLIHRDIKPGNVLIEGSQARAKITDFGLARAADDASISQSGVIAGTPMYMAPEQALGKNLDQRADLFSLGSVLYQMVTGRPPFRANGTLAVLKRVAEDDPRAIREIIPETPRWLCDIIAKLHAKDPADRFRSAREVADVLADCEAQLRERGTVRTVAGVPRVRTPRRRGPTSTRTLVGLGIVLTVLAYLAVAYFVVSRRGPINDDERWTRHADGAEVPGWGRATDPDGDCKIQSMNGPVRLTAPTKHDLQNEPWPRNAPRVMREVSGDFRARVRVYPFTDVGRNRGIEAQPMIAGSLVMMSGKDRVFRVDRVLQFEKDMGGRNLRHDVVAFPWDPSVKAPVGLRRIEALAASYLEIERVGDTVSARTSLNGKSWSEPCVQTWPAEIDTVWVGVAAICVNSPEPHRVTFEDFEVTPLEPEGRPAAGFSPLFNGKDLAGWREHLDGGTWRVTADGQLTGAGQGHLFTKRDFADFHLRAEMRVDEGGDGGLLFRCDRATLDGKVPVGFEAAVNPTNQQSPRTGSLMDPRATYIYGKDPRIPPGEWFTYEVIADGGHITLKVNGQTTLAGEHGDPKRLTGPIGLQLPGDSKAIHFRKLEIRELPAKLPKQ